MKGFTALAVCAIAALLASCQSHKVVSTRDQTTTATYVDTTATVSDTLGHKTYAIDTTKTSASIEHDAIVEFVNGGGKVSIDSAGNLTLEGVARINDRRKASFAQADGIAEITEETAEHREQANGIGATQAMHEESAEQTTPARRWYETALMRIGLAASIAAIMWLLYRYLKRKF